MLTVVEWCDDVIKNKSELRTGEWNFFDKVFNNEMNVIAKEAIHHYSKH